MDSVALPFLGNWEIFACELKTGNYATILQNVTGNDVVKLEKKNQKKSEVEYDMSLGH